MSDFATRAKSLARSIMSDVTDDHGSLRSYAYAEKQIAAALEEVLVDAAKGKDVVEKILRTEWWLNHGCESPVLYGDDGEMQCNGPGCVGDFRRTPIDELCLFVGKQRIRQVVKTLADGS